MIRVTPQIAIDESEITLRFIRASGPGGQKINKAATAVQLRFNVRQAKTLPEDVRERLLRLGGKRVTHRGVLVIDARRFRTQERNRQDAIDRLVILARKAAKRPKVRRATKPTAAAKKRRLDAKRRRGEIKRRRRQVASYEN